MVEQIKNNSKKEIYNIDENNQKHFHFDSTEELLQKVPNILLDTNINVLANTKAELWWIWNSVMDGIKLYNSWFVNFNWATWKSIINHPNRFNNNEDVLLYKKEHPWVKSLVLYFWANNPSATLWWLKKHVELLRQNRIQPVLCTCLFEQQYPALTQLNEDIRNLWTRNKIPVLDFARVWNLIQYSWSNPHPTVDWYKMMAKMIEVSCWLQW